MDKNKMWHLYLYFTMRNRRNLNFYFSVIDQLFFSSFVKYKGDYEFQKWLKLNNDITINFNRKNHYSHITVCIEIIGVSDKYLASNNKMNFIKEFLSMLFNKDGWKIDKKIFENIKASLNHQALHYEYDASRYSFDQNLRFFFDEDTYLKLTLFNKEEIDDIDIYDIEAIFHQMVSSYTRFIGLGFNEEELEEIKSLLPKVNQLPLIQGYNKRRIFKDHIIVKEGYGSCLSMGFHAPNINRVYEEFIIYSFVHEEMFFFEHLRETCGYFYYFEPYYMPDFSYMVLSFPISYEVLLDVLVDVQDFFTDPEKHCSRELFNNILNEFLLDIKASIGSKEERIDFERKEMMETSPKSFDEYVSMLSNFTYENYVVTLKNLKYVGSVFVESEDEEDDAF